MKSSRIFLLLYYQFWIRKESFKRVLLRRYREPSVILIFNRSYFLETNFHIQRKILSYFSVSADHPEVLNILGCSDTIFRRGKHHECTLFESLASMGGSCSSTRTFSQTIQPVETTLTDTWEDLESAGGWRFTDFDIQG